MTVLNKTVSVASLSHELSEGFGEETHTLRAILESNLSLFFCGVVPTTPSNNQWEDLQTALELSTYEFYKDNTILAKKTTHRFLADTKSILAGN